MPKKKDTERDRGHPRSFLTEDDFCNTFEEYLSSCIATEQLPNIAGFCWFSKITRETFYKQKDYYSDTYNKIQDALENAALNHKATAMGIFYLKNKFKYRDRIETENVNLNHDMSEDEANEILKRYGKDTDS
jgi:hypothetical protein